MNPAPAKTKHSWSEFLNLGETLLKQPNADSISSCLENEVESRFKCHAHLWLAEPYYPLPGEPVVITLPNPEAPDSVRKSFKQKKLIFKKGPEFTTLKNSPLEICLPIITQNNLLGVLHVLREAPNSFTVDEIETLEAICAYAAVAMQTNRQVALKNWRYDQISLVRSVSSQIANILDLDELCKRVTNLIQCSFNYYHVAIFTLDEGEKNLHFRASSLQCEPNLHPLFSVKFGDGLIGTAAKTGQEYVVKNVLDEPRFQFTPALPKTRAEVVLPLIIENRVLGVLDIQSEIADAFHENDMLVLRSLADNIALAVEGARLYNSLEKRAGQLSAVLDIGLALSSILDLDELLKEIVDVIHKQFSIPFVNIFTVHLGRRRIIYEAGSGSRAEKLKAHSFAYDIDAPDGIIPHVARTGKSMLSNNVANQPLYKPSRITPQQTKSELSIPLNFGDDVLGVLDLQSDEINHFSQADIDLFESLASGIALAIRNATLFRSERWRRKVGESFQDVAGLLSTSLALPELLDTILENLEKILPCDSSAIWLLDNLSNLPIDERPMRLAAVHGTTAKRIIDSTEESIAIREFLNYGISGNQPVIRKPEDPYGPLGAACKYPSRYSSIAVPLKSGDEIMGVLTLAHRTEGRYGSEASAISETFANYAAVAIQNARLYTTAQEDAWSSTVLLQVAEAIKSINSVTDLLSTIVRLTPLLVGIDQCAVWLSNFSNNAFELKNWYGFQPGENEMLVKDYDRIAFLKMRASATPIFVENPKDELGLSSIKMNPKTGTMVLLPLISHGEIQGAFLVSHNSNSEIGIQNRFSNQTLAILQGIAQQTSIALENIRLVENRQEEAYITAVLLQVAHAVVSQNKLDDILDTIVQLMPILVGVDTCVIYLWDKLDEKFIPSNVVTPQHADREFLLQHSFSTGDFPLLDRIKETENMAGCAVEEPISSVKKWMSLKCESQPLDFANIEGNFLLGFPLIIKGELFGTMLTSERKVPVTFHQKRIELLTGVAQQTALAIQNERLREEKVGRERVEREFQLARQIQKTFLPESLPEPEGWDIDLRWQTAQEVGGDFYDAFITSDKKLAFAIADVADKGMPAALYMTVTRTLIRAVSQSLSSPADILARVNELLYSDSQNGMFVTAIFALLDPATGVIQYANAGHNLPLVFRSDDIKVERLEKGSIALGVIENAQYDNSDITIGPGDTILLYTDGVTESFSSAGEQFSEKRLIKTLLELKCESADQLLSNLGNEIDKFRAGESASDDLTMIAIHRKNIQK